MDTEGGIALKKLLPILCSVIVLASIGGGFAVAGASTETARSFTGTLTVTREVTSLVWQHADPDKISVGDRFEFTSNLVKNGDVIGHQGAVCTILRVSGDRNAYICDGTYRLPGGTIAAQAYRPASHPASKVAITGGTGIYRDARGQIEVDGDKLTFEVS